MEIDLHQTKDGEIILLHDNDLSRVAVGIGCPLGTNVSELEFDLIQSKCKLKNGDAIAMLDDVFNLLQNQTIVINLDLKDELSERSIKKIVESGFPLSRLRLRPPLFPNYSRPLRLRRSCPHSKSTRGIRCLGTKTSDI